MMTTKTKLTLAAAILTCGATFGAANLRFGFLTDTHIDAQATNLARLRGAFTLFKTNNVDLVVHGGDLADKHYPAAYTAISNLYDEVFGAASKPRFIAAVGNHDTLMGLGSLSSLEAAVETLALAGAENTHTGVSTVNGYTFLTMPYSVGSTAEGFLSWADYETAVANACQSAGEGRPVFLLEHKPPQDTIYNSHDWGYAESKAILARYPQVVELSGHVHGSLRCDRCLWQGDFTVLNAGCLGTWQGLLKGVAATSNNKSIYDALIVEVEDAQIVAYRYDVLTGEEIDAARRWVIPLPFDAATAPYNLERRTAAEAANPPAFGADDALTVKAGSTYRTFTLAFPEVAENAFTYWITVQRWQGNAWTNLVETEIFSEFWKQTAAKTGRASVTVTDDAFEPGAAYRFCVQPVGQYGTKGVAITATATAATAGDKPDGFVEYVRLTSTQYFDTGIIGRSGTKAEVDFKLDKTGDDWSLLDCRKDETDSRFFLFHTSGGFAAYGYGQYKRQDAYPLVSGRRYLAASELKAGLQTLDLDGKRIVTATDAQTIDTGINLFLGACNFPTRGKPLYASMARIYALKLWQTDANGTYRLVRDFVPCMAAGGLDAGGANRRTRVGALYDRVSGRIFFAHSASDYSAGVAGSDTSAYLPDVWNSTSQGRPDFFVKYIRSTGSQILDTGVPARAGLRVEGDLMYTAGESGPEAAYLGTSCSAYAMIVDRPSSGTAWGGFGTYGVSTRYLTNETTQTAARWELNRDYHIAATYGKSGESTIVQNGATIYRQSNVAQETGQNLMMFASRRDNWPAYTAHARCYGLKMWLDDVLVRDFRPCVKGGKPGLYDVVRNEVVFPLGDIDITTVGATVNEDGSPISQAWVQTTSAQYVDLGVVGRSGTKIEMEFLLPNANDDGDHAIIGARGSGDTRFYPIHSHQNCGRTGYRVFKYLTDPLPDNVKHHVVSDLRAGSQIVTIDDTEVYHGTDTAAFDTGYNLYLGAANIEGTAKYNWPVRVYSLKIWQTATTAASDTDYRLVRDFVPACNGDWTSPGALYDRVSGTNFKPKSTKTEGADTRFRILENTPAKVMGPPDALVEYIESDGVQMIDTGVAIEAGLKAEGEMMWTGRFANEQTHLGSTHSGNRLYLCHSAWGNVWFGYAGLGHYPLDQQTGNKITWGQNVRQHYVVDYTDPAHLTAVIDGKTVMDIDASAYTYKQNTGTLAVFAARVEDVPEYSSKSRCYGFTVCKNGTPIRNYLPCVKNGQGGLYDAVNDEVYLPVMGTITGGLIGPITNGTSLAAKRYVEYVETDGNAWIDTGVIGRSGTKTLVEFTPLWVPQAGSSWSAVDMGILGARSSTWGSNRFYPAHAFMGLAGYGYGEYYNSTAALTNGATHTLESELCAGLQRIVLDGEEVGVASIAGTVDTGVPLYLGAVNVGGEAQFRAPMRIHRVKIWQTATTDANDTTYELVRNYEPVVTEGGIIGLKDSVHGTLALPKHPFSACGKRLPTGHVIILR